MPDPNTEHGLRVQLATALREGDDYLARAVNAERRIEDMQALREKQDAELVTLRADVKRLRAALENLNAHLDFSVPWEADESFKDPSGINAAFAQARAALATGGDRG